MGKKQNNRKRDGKKERAREDKKSWKSVTNGKKKLDSTHSTSQ